MRSLPPTRAVFLFREDSLRMLEPQKFRKKPVVVEAIQWTGDNLAAIYAFVGSSATYTSEGDMMIHTLEGDHHAIPSDWIIKGVRGEFYPCKADIFERTYELA
jgi:hypothetical protein